MCLGYFLCSEVCFGYNLYLESAPLIKNGEYVGSVSHPSNYKITWKNSNEGRLDYFSDTIDFSTLLFIKHQIEVTKKSAYTGKEYKYFDRSLEASLWIEPINPISVFGKRDSKTWILRGTLVKMERYTPQGAFFAFGENHMRDRMNAFLPGKPIEKSRLPVCYDQNGKIQDASSYSYSLRSEICHGKIDYAFLGKICPHFKRVSLGEATYEGDASGAITGIYFRSEESHRYESLEQFFVCDEVARGKKTKGYGYQYKLGYLERFSINNPRVKKSIWPSISEGGSPAVIGCATCNYSHYKGEMVIKAGTKLYMLDRKISPQTLLGTLKKDIAVKMNVGCKGGVCKKIKTFRLRNHKNRNVYFLYSSPGKEDGEELYLKFSLAAPENFPFKVNQIVPNNCPERTASIH